MPHMRHGCTPIAETQSLEGRAVQASSEDCAICALLVSTVSHASGGTPPHDARSVALA